MGIKDMLVSVAAVVVAAALPVIVTLLTYLAIEETAFHRHLNKWEDDARAKVTDIRSKR